MNIVEPVGEDELHALADGQLSSERQAAVQKWLETHPEEAARVERWRTVNGEIRQACDLSGDASGGGVRARRLLAYRRRRARRWLTAVLIMLLVGGAGGWIAREVISPDPSPGVQFADEGIGAYRVYAGEVRHPVEVAADERQHLQAWLSKRLDHGLVVPDLSDAGYRLVGGRLLASFAEPRALFMYEAADGGRLTVYAGRNPLSREVAFRFHQSGDVGAICWLDPEMGYAVVAKAQEPALIQVAHLVQEQMERAEAR